MPDRQIVKPFEEMPDLKGIGLESWGFPKDWGVCVVGAALEKEGVREGTMCVKHFAMDGDDAVETFYPVPANVSVLIAAESKYCVQRKLTEIRTVLGYT